jgi:single-stranded DNA-binding protein
MDGIEAAAAGVVMKAPELRTSQKGTAWCFFNVAIGHGEARQYAKVTAFGEVAERVCQTVEKGAKVYFEGKLAAGIWKPDRGEPRINLDIAAWRVELLGQIGKQRPKREQRQAPARGGREYAPEFDDQIPL